jgi:hypothetical protein
MATEVFYKGRQRLYRSTAESPVKGRSVWERLSVLPHMQDPATRVLFRQDFDQLTIASNTINGWTFTNATSGTITQVTNASNGIVNINAGAATANQGVNWQLNAPVIQLHATRPTILEARVRFTGLTNLRVQALFGMFAISTALIASGAVANVKGLGFAGVTTTGVLAARTYDASAGSGTGLTVANSTWYRLGIVATTALAEFFVDGVRVSSITSQIPTDPLAPAFVCQANGTDTPVMQVDYVAFSEPRV